MKGYTKQDYIEKTISIKITLDITPCIEKTV